jgi:MFS family permease
VAAMSCRCEGSAAFFANVSTMCETCSGAEITCADSRQIHVTFGLLCESHVTLSLPSSVVMIGIGLGAIIGGSISDRVGRRPTLLCSLAVQVLAAGLSAAATGLAPYLVLRLLCGVGMSGATQAGFTLATEIIGPRYRTVLTTELWAYQCVAAVLKHSPS